MLRQKAIVTASDHDAAIEVELLVADWGVARQAAQLIKREHYRPDMPPGHVLVCRALNPGVANSIRGGTVGTKVNHPGLLGALVLSSGCSYSKPSGRRELAKKHFPRIDFDALDRGTIVKRMGLMMIRRVAVEADFRGYGIGTLLAQFARKAAAELTREAKFIEVMTTRGHKEAQAVVNGTANKTDFLVRAGYKPASIFTRSRGGCNKFTLYYWAPVER